jgi:molybdenum cofactor biosynthesis enzyme MoaA
MTDDFCATCNRLRLTADGKVKACLFGDQELLLRDALRSKNDEHTVDIIARAVREKKAKLGGFDSPQAIAQSGTNRPMILIGG